MAAATAKTRLPNARTSRTFDGMRTRTLKTNIALLRALLAGGLPGTPRLSRPVTQAMTERLEMFRRELALRDERDQSKLHEGRNQAHARKRSQPMSPQALQKRLSVLESRGVRVVLQ
jgi:hypothetical protein